MQYNFTVTYKRLPLFLTVQPDKNRCDRSMNGIYTAVNWFLFSVRAWCFSCAKTCVLNYIRFDAIARTKMH